ncbi:MAG: M43 family zinc metalloprotease [Bacteroidia bacterium]|nr:M43 family zinc metalloprotease [Bacteroidia bacterium]MDW8332744.1 M43 family zinc metalloprotease [Bacteroidia bacterium]
MRKTRLSLAWAVAALLLCVYRPIHAQEMRRHRCGVEEIERKIESDPEFRRLFEESEIYVQNALPKGGLRFHNPGFDAAKTSGDDDTRSRYIIPTVVHIVYSGPSSNISEQRVRNMFQMLFEKYRNLPGTPGYSDLGVDTRIEFALATRDPSGQPHSGITREANADASNHHKNDDESLKSSRIWDPTRYFNIWVVNKIDTDEGALAGYAQFPWMEGANTDGIVVIAEDVGVRSAQGYSRTVDHEAGHWLNLLHPFNFGCAIGAHGDNILDTPPVANNEFKNTNDRLNTCNEGASDLPDNPRNVMDYTSDDSRCNLITRGQSARMRAALENENFWRRFPLWQPDNLEATGTGPWGPPTANFWADRRVVCPGVPVTFLDYSRNAPTTFKWKFPGGTPDSSNDYRPVVTYSTPGKYSVTLTVNNYSGVESSITLNDFITVLPDTVTYPVPFVENFRASTFPPPDWQVENSDAHPFFYTFTWDRANTGAFGTSNDGSARMNLFNYSDYGARDGLITPFVSFKDRVNPRLSFAYAYRPLRYSKPTGTLPAYDYIYTDTLEIWASKDCGQTWTRLFRKGGLELSTVPGTPSATSDPTTQRTDPASFSQWKDIQINFPESFNGAERVKVKFETICGFGNDLLIDDVTITADEDTCAGLPNCPDSCVVNPELCTSRPDGIARTRINVFPNPFSSSTVVSFDFGRTATLKLEAMDLTGKTVWHGEQTAAAGEIEIDLSRRPAGAYLLRATVNDTPMPGFKLIKRDAN